MSKREYARSSPLGLAQEKRDEPTSIDGVLPGMVVMLQRRRVAKRGCPLSFGRERDHDGDGECRTDNLLLAQSGGLAPSRYQIRSTPYHTLLAVAIGPEAIIARNAENFYKFDFLNEVGHESFSGLVSES